MDNRILVAATGVNEMKPSPEQVREWVAQIKSESGEGYTQELCELAAAWGASQAQQTTEPLGFQIRRAIAAEDELRATKQTLEHAYAALQKVADAQAAIEEPELPEAEVHVRHGFDRNGSHSMGEYMCECGAHGDQPCKSDLYTATQMHDHYAAGVRAGMAQSQDAKRLDWLAIHGSFGVDSVTGLPGGNGQKRIAATRQAVDAAMQGGQK